MRERWQFAYLFLGGRSCVLEDSHMRLILTSKRNIRNIRNMVTEYDFFPRTTAIHFFFAKKNFLYRFFQRQRNEKVEF